MDGDKRILYLPLENRVRELDARLLLSLTAATANFQVVIGPKWLLALNIAAIPRGLYATKTLNKLDADGMRSAIHAGHAPLAWDDEGPGQIVPEIYLKGVDDGAVKLAGKIFAWGNHQAATISHKYPMEASKVLASGNPRWDLLRPEYRAYYSTEVDAIRERFGRFILINTNFSSYNTAFSDAAIAAIADETGAFKKSDDSEQKILRDIVAFEKQTLEDYVSLLPFLSAAFPDHKIIIRPHPTEKHEVWARLAHTLPNVECVFERTVVPWMIAAEAVIQNSCTTGVEALTLGRPVVSYCRSKSDLQEWHLANHVCPRVHDVGPLIERLRSFISDPASFKEPLASGHKTLSKHISHFTGEPASLVISKALVFYAHKLEKRGTKLPRSFSMAGSFRPYPDNHLYRRKVAPIQPSEIADKVVKLTRCNPNIGRVTITQVAESCFLFRR
ncbi:MAG: surface carbohydrate biosynthesis protein [Rhodospirillaceae bacterium]